MKSFKSKVWSNGILRRGLSRACPGANFPCVLQEPTLGSGVRWTRSFGFLSFPGKFFPFLLFSFLLLLFLWVFLRSLNKLRAGILLGPGSLYL